jgi:outer membrane protein assembly factor BamB
MRRLGGFQWAIPAATILVLFLAKGRADDWPQWRGANRDGVSREAGPKDWPAEGPSLLWSSTNLGKGFSAVAVVKEKIFTLGDRGDASFVSALDEKTGKEVWSAKLGKPGAPGWGGFEGPRATPTVDGKLLYVVGQWGELVCAESASGKEVWRKEYTKDFSAARPEWGFAESPLIDGDKVVVTPGGDHGAVVALQKETGAPVWSSTDFKDAAQYTSLIRAEIDGVAQYIVMTSAHVAGISAQDGKTLWSSPCKGQTAVIPTPIYRDGFVYVAAGYGVGCHLFKISSENGKFKSEQVYANKVMVNHHGGVIPVGENVYGYSDGKGWTCQNFKTGEAVWQEKEKLRKGSLVAVGDRLVLRQEDKAGVVALIEASPDGYKEHGRFTPSFHSDKNIWAHPVVANGKLYLRDENVLLCYALGGR